MSRSSLSTAVVVVVVVAMAVLFSSRTRGERGEWSRPSFGTGSDRPFPLLGHDTSAMTHPRQHPMVIGEGDMCTGVGIERVKTLAQKREYRSERVEGSRDDTGTYTHTQTQGRFAHLVSDRGYMVRIRLKESLNKPT